MIIFIHQPYNGQSTVKCMMKFKKHDDDPEDGWQGAGLARGNTMASTCFSSSCERYLELRYNRFRLFVGRWSDGLPSHDRKEQDLSEQILRKV